MVEITGPQYVIYCWTMSVVCLVFILLRLQIRRRTRGGLKLSDYFVILAWLAYIYQNVTDTFTLTKGLYIGKIDPYAKEFGPEHGLATYDETVLVLKLLYVELAFYYTEMYFVKGAMLAFYYELFPKSMPRLRMALHIVSATTVVGWVTSVLIKLFLCLPIEVNYTPGPHFCSAINSKNSNYYEWAFHVLTDLMIYCLPLFLLQSLRMPKRQKYAVGCTFGVGFVCLIWANLFQVSLLLDWPTAASWFCAATEEWWCLIVVCCPTFRALINKKDFRSAWRYIRGEHSGVHDKDAEYATGSHELSTTGRVSTMVSMSRKDRALERKGSEQWIGEGIGNITETIEITRTVKTHSDSDSASKDDIPVVETVVISDNHMHTVSTIKQPVKSFYFV